MEPFAHEDAADFLRCLHRDVTGHETAIARLCGNLPLALRLAAAALENAPHLTVEKYVARLADAAERHDIMSDVDAALDVTCDLLEPKLRGCFAALCVFVEGCECDEAGAVWGVREREAEQIVGKLLEFNLIKWNSSRSVYEMHDVIRDYARMKLLPEEEAVARTRHAELAAKHARVALELFQAGGERTEAGLSLWDAKSKDILQALSWTAGRLEDDLAACGLASDLAEHSWHLFEVRYPTLARVPLVGLGQEAASRLNDRRRRGVHLRRQGFLLLEGRMPAAAEKALEEALELSRLGSDREGEGIALGYLGRAYCEQGRVADGLLLLQQSLEIAEERQDKRQIGISLGRLADMHLRQKDHDDARRYYRRAIEIEEEIDDISGLAIDHAKLGVIDAEEGDKESAAVEFEKAAAAHHQLRHPAEEVKLLLRSAGLYGELNRPEMAERCFDQIVAVVDQSYKDTPERIGEIYQVAVAMTLWPLAIRMADSMIRHFPDHHRGWIRKAQALRRADPVKGLSDAVAVLREGRQHFPKEDIFAYDLACYTALLGDGDGAMGYLQEAAEICGHKEQIREEASQDEDLKGIWDRLATW